MKSRLLIFLSIVLLVAVLAALNAASYVRVEREAETELLPDRSTLNSGGTGTRALFEYLRESGADAVRWRQPMSALAGPERPASLVIVGPTSRVIENGEAVSIIGWVSAGGRLVLIDREPSPLLLPRVGRWRVYAQTVESPGTDSDPYDAERLALSGDLRGAIRKAYVALLCELGDRGVVRLAQHQTNRDYLNALRRAAGRPGLYAEMLPLTFDFEVHWYGLRDATASDWESFKTRCRTTLKGIK